MTDVNIFGGGMASSELGNWPKAASVARQRRYTDWACPALREWLLGARPCDDEGGIAVEASGAAFIGSPTL